LPEAEGVYRAVLTAQPENADALHLLGVLACDAGKTEAGIALVQQAIRLRPTVAPFHNTLGNAMASLRRVEEARFAFEWALQLNPDFVEARVNLGNLLQDLNQPDEAVTHYRRALETRPMAAEIHNNLGNALRRSGALEDSIAAFRLALRLNQHYPEAYVNLAAALLAANSTEEAAHCCEEAIRQNPLLAAAHSNYAAVLLAQSSFGKAEAASREALRLQSEYAEAHHNLGNALRAQGMYGDAVFHYREALRLRPDLEEATRTLSATFLDEAVMLSKQCRFAEAEAICRTNLDSDPDDADSYRILGNIYFRQRRLNEAGVCYAAALKLRPEDAGAHYNRALLLLLRGEFEEGWQEYEWRWQRPDARICAPAQPRWQGEPLDGRRILICAEQGLGDCIQFLRYLPMVREAGGRVIFQCPSALTTWMEKLPGITEVADLAAAPPEADFHAPLLSLPRVFRTSLESIPSHTPYLSPPPHLLDAWRERLASYDGLRAGLVWAGSPQNSEDTNRSIPLTQLQPLCDTPGVSMICLQQGAGTGELPIHYLGDWGSIEDFAAIMMNLDLVISVDTMPAHLAGALGRPVWTLLRFAADYRWLLDREDSPWYPTMRLFRQPCPGDWDSIVRAVGDALRLYASRK
jgi:tetratricopeptide (TPR) repeat protein